MENNKSAGAALLSAAPKKPRAGLYGDDVFFDAYLDLVRSLGELIPSDLSHGAAGLEGVCPRAMARCKAITAKAKIMEDTMKANCQGRK